MGDHLTHKTAIPRAADESVMVSVPAWLDGSSSALVRDIVVTLAHHHPDVRAVILFGSVARHDEHPLADSQPSDVDLLAIFDTDEDPTHLPRGLEITHTIGLARNRHLDAPREIQLMFATRDLREWDSTFVANVARDGILLWARGSLPVALSAIEQRPSMFSNTDSPASLRRE